MPKCTRCHLIQEIKTQRDGLDDEVPELNKKTSKEDGSVAFLPPAASCSQSGSIDEHTCGMALDGNMSTYSQTSSAYPSVGSWFFVDLGYPILMDSIRMWIPNATERGTDNSGLAARAVAPVPFMITFLNSSDRLGNSELAKTNKSAHDSVRVSSVFQSNIKALKVLTAQRLQKINDFYESPCAGATKIKIKRSRKI